MCIPESALCALTNGIKMNKRKELFDNFNYELELIWFLKQKKTSDHYNHMN